MEAGEAGGEGAAGRSAGGGEQGGRAALPLRALCGRLPAPLRMTASAMRRQGRSSSTMQGLSACYGALGGHGGRAGRRRTVVEHEQRDEREREGHHGREHGLPRVGRRGVTGIPPPRQGRNRAPEQALLRPLPVLAVVGCQQAPIRRHQRDNRRRPPRPVLVLQRPPPREPAAPPPPRELTSTPAASSARARLHGRLQSPERRRGCGGAYVRDGGGVAAPPTRRCRPARAPSHQCIRGERISIFAPSLSSIANCRLLLRLLLKRFKLRKHAVQVQKEAGVQLGKEN
ncbi:hypothetical protein EJB05_26616, partial [Eragrostis curvula]